LDQRRIRGASAELQGRARQLRREMTDAERVLWNGIRGWELGKWRRQHPVGRFILDFYCPAAKLCVEVDGSVHDLQEERDAARTAELEAMGVRVIRFRNEAVLKEPRTVLFQIEAAVRSDPAAGYPLPHVGEGGEPKRAG
jgi:very-short-patch-repair endonuclease